MNINSLSDVDWLGSIHIQLGILRNTLTWKYSSNISPKKAGNSLKEMLRYNFKVDIYYLSWSKIYLIEYLIFSI